ncbi:MAG: glycosyltransferase family 2 protein [Phycisphaerales bacterium]
MGDHLPISVAIVCKDSARTIERVLASVAGWAGEIVAVDSGSTDGTIEILERFGARVIRSDWLGQVKTKQKALEACDQAWVLALDSDEPVEPDLAESIAAFVRADGRGHDGAMVNRKIWYRGRFLNHAWQPEWRLRLVRAGAAAWGGHDPHDKLELTSGGTVERLAGTLRHESFETFAEQFAKDSGYARLMATNLHAAGARGSRLRCVTSPIGAFAKQMVIKQAWRDGRAGWLAALATASATLQKHAVLLELRQDQ